MGFLKALWNGLIALVVTGGIVIAIGAMIVAATILPVILIIMIIFVGAYLAVTEDNPP